MSDTTPTFALNIMMLTFDTFYLIRDDDVQASKDTMEFVLSNPTVWVHDATMRGYKCSRTALFEGS